MRYDTLVWIPNHFITGHFKISHRKSPGRKKQLVWTPFILIKTLVVNIIIFKVGFATQAVSLGFKHGVSCIISSLVVFILSQLSMHNNHDMLVTCSASDIFPIVFYYHT